MVIVILRDAGEWASAMGEGNERRARPAHRLDEFDLRLRRALVAAFVGGSIAHFVVIRVAPDRALGGPVFAHAMVLLGLVSELLIPRLPWGRYGRDLFAAILLYSAALITGLIYSTGGVDSSFAATFLLITISAGLYHTNRLALVIAVACAGLGFVPYLYDTPGDDFLIRQTVLGVSALACIGFHRLMVPELLRRARAERGLQDDLRETRRLRDELARANALLARQARTDALTNLPNHGAIVAQADAALAGATARGEALSILFFDIDHFKGINDTHGHQAGDRVLAALARRAVAALRHGDTVGRYGGEEFLAILPATDAAAAVAVAERLRLAVAGTPFALPDGTACAVTVSVGVATSGDGADNRAVLLHAADLALYRAKAAGRDQVCCLAA